MDLDDLIGGIGSTRTPSKRGQWVARLVLGGILGVLGIAGAYRVATADGGAALRMSGVLMFGALAAFGLLGISCGLRVRLFGCLFLVSVAVLFATRILFGA